LIVVYISYELIIENKNHTIYQLDYGKCITT